MTAITRRLVIDVPESGELLLTSEHEDGSWMQIRDASLPGIVAQCNALRNAQADREAKAQEAAEKEAAKPNA